MSIWFYIVPLILLLVSGIGSLIYYKYKHKEWNLLQWLKGNSIHDSDYSLFHYGLFRSASVAMLTILVSYISYEIINNTSGTFNLSYGRLTDHPFIKDWLGATAVALGLIAIIHRSIVTDEQIRLQQEAYDNQTNSLDLQRDSQRMRNFYDIKEHFNDIKSLINNNDNQIFSMEVKENSDELFNRIFTSTKDLDFSISEPLLTKITNCLEEQEFFLNSCFPEGKFSKEFSKEMEKVVNTNFLFEDPDPRKIDIKYLRSLQRISRKIDNESTIDTDMKILYQYLMLEVTNKEEKLNLIENLQKNYLILLGITKGIRRVIKSLPIEDQSDSIEKKLEKYRLLGVNNFELSKLKQIASLAPSHSLKYCLYYNEITQGLVKRKELKIKVELILNYLRENHAEPDVVAIIEDLLLALSNRSDSDYPEIVREISILKHTCESIQ